MNDQHEKIKDLFKMKEQGMLTEEEFDQQKKILLKAKLEPAITNGQDTIPTNASLFEGVEIGGVNRKFRLTKAIGSGGMGQVWQARDLAEERVYSEQGKTITHRYKALKVVNTNLMHSVIAIKQLQKEAMRSAELKHPNIINVFGWHEGSEGWLFVEMEFLQGHDLEEYLSQYDAGLSWEDSLPIIQGIADGLAYAHEKKQIIHRDLKPGNIFITHQKKITILDFGLAYQLRKTRVTLYADSQFNFNGTTEYMPPEAFFANIPDQRYDVYAFACLIYEILTGQAPFSKEKATKREADEWPPQPDGIKLATWQALKGGLAYDKERRTGSVRELWEGVLSTQNSINVGVIEELNENFELQASKVEVRTKKGYSFSKVAKVLSYIVISVGLLLAIFFYKLESKVKKPEDSFVLKSTQQQTVVGSLSSKKKDIELKLKASEKIEPEDSSVLKSTQQQTVVGSLSSKKKDIELKLKASEKNEPEDSSILKWKVADSLVNDKEDRLWSEKIYKREECTKDKSIYLNLEYGEQYRFGNRFANGSVKVILKSGYATFFEKENYNGKSGKDEISFKLSDSLSEANGIMEPNTKHSTIKVDHPYQIMNRPFYFSDNKFDSNIVVVYDTKYYKANVVTDKVEEHNIRDCVFYRIVKPIPSPK